jgi:hypothetical protein
VVVDTTTDSSFTTTTTGALSTKQIGVILEPNGIANNATGLVALGGYCPKINLNTASTRGQFLKTYTVAGQATPHSSPQVEGDFAVALTASATPEAILFGSPNPPSSGGAGTVTTTGSPTSGQLAQFSGATSITGIAIGNICEGRLTTETGVPISTVDRSAQSTIYWKPCTPAGKAKTSGAIALYDGTNLVVKVITELSKALTITSGKNKNIYIDYNAGTPQLILGADWTNDTTESETLADQNGILVLSGTPAYRYVGVIRADGANTVADSGGITGTTQVGGKRFVWNAYNQVERQLKVIDTTDSWPYTVTGTIRQANGAAGNKVEYVSGDVSMLVKAKVVANLLSSNTASVAKAGVGVDSTTTFSGLVGAGYLSVVAASTVLCPLVSFYEGQPGLGYHFLSWNEKGATSATFLGDDGADSSQSGLTATIWG